MAINEPTWLQIEMDKEKVVVTGLNGFVGKHLAKELFNNNISIIGVGQEGEPHPQTQEMVDDYFQADLVKAWPEIQDVRTVIHLAGLAAVGPSFDNPQEYINVNGSMVTNLCEYYLRRGEKTRIILITSGAIYSSNQTIPISESGQIDCSSPYEISKILNERQAEYYRNRGLDCVVVRPFNHIGPGQKAGFILPDLHAKLLNISKDSNAIITGNIETKRDYTDVRDITKAYVKLAISPSLAHNTYNLCSGASVAGSEIFNILKEEMGLDTVTYTVDKSYIRPNDSDNIIGDSSRISQELGWKPKISLRKTIRDFLETFEEVH